VITTEWKALITVVTFIDMKWKVVEIIIYLIILIIDLIFGDPDIKYCELDFIKRIAQKEASGKRLVHVLETCICKELMLPNFQTTRRQCLHISSICCPEKVDVCKCNH
jgi:hypothetical protein